MAVTKKETPSKKVPNGFYKNNTEEVEFPDGTKKRVFKHEAKYLRDKFKNSAKLRKRFGGKE